MVRIYISIERNGAWDDQCTILMSTADIQSAAKFVTDAAREIFSETTGSIVEIAVRH